MRVELLCDCGHFRDVHSQYRYDELPNGQLVVSETAETHSCRQRASVAGVRVECACTEFRPCRVPA